MDIAKSRSKVLHDRRDQISIAIDLDEARNEMDPKDQGRGPDIVVGPIITHAHRLQVVTEGGEKLPKRLARDVPEILTILLQHAAGNTRKHDD